MNFISGLAADLCMFAAYNGAVSDMQLKWLEETLTKAERDKEKVIIAGELWQHRFPTVLFGVR